MKINRVFFGILITIRKGNHVTTCPDLTSMKNTQCKLLVISSVISLLLPEYIYAIYIFNM